MAKALVLVVKMVMAELVPYDFTKNLTAKSLVNLRIKVQMTIRWKEAPASCPQASVPMSLVQKGLVKVFLRDFFDIIS